MRETIKTLVLFAILSVAFSFTISAQSECSLQAGRPGDFVIKNDLSFDIEVKFVDKNCKEDEGITIGAGKYLEVSAYEYQLYRVYENFTSRFLSDIRLSLDKPAFSVTGFQKTLDPAVKLCSKSGIARPIAIRNATRFPIEIRHVNTDCGEVKGPDLIPGKGIGGQSYVNTVIRAYNKQTGEFVSQIVIRQTVRNYLIGAEPAAEPKTGFINTVNAIRWSEGLAAIKLDDTLAKSCNWFVEFMAQKDAGHAGHLVSEFTNDSKYKLFNKPEQRLKQFGWSGKNFAETTAMQTTGDFNLLGSHFALEWMASTTHYRPFYDKDSNKYDRVGFAIAKSANYPNSYYGCAIFGQSK